jgi:pimeloyl-ACP methyl ester carboxylesterase
VEAWRHSGTIEVFHYGENRNCRIGYQLLADAGRYEDFPDFLQPALIFHGTHDDSVPISLSREFSTNHPNAVLEVLDSNHQLLNVLDYMAPKIARFVTGS